ncbi:LolA family protein [Aquimarina rhabdastrellae]
MKKIILFCVLWCSALSIQAQEKAMAAKDIAEFKEAVENIAKKFKTATADFIQIKHIDFLSNDIESRGKLYIKYPDKLRWGYTEPYSYNVIYKDEKLFINDEGKKTKIDLQSNKMFKELNKLLKEMTNGKMFDDTRFDLSFFETPKEYIVKAIPKDPRLKKMFNSLETVYSKKTHWALSIKTIEESGDYTLTIYENVQIDKPISDEIFTH